MAKPLIDPFDSEYKTAEDPSYSGVDSGLVDPFDEPAAPKQVQQQAPATVTDKVKEKVEPDTWEKFKNIFTGADRETRATQELPELITSGVIAGEDPAKVSLITPILLTTLDPMEQAQILQANFPSIGIQEDEKGNIIVGNNKTGVKAVVNKPGLSEMDLLQGGTLIGEYTPAGRAGGGAMSVLGGATKVGIASGLTETVNQGLQSAAGGEFNSEDVAIAGVGGALFETIGAGLYRAFQGSRGVITPEMRDTFRQSAVEVGIDPKTITDDVIGSYMEHATKATQTAPEGEFGIRYTRGQRSGESGQLMLEDRLKMGASGKARDKMSQFTDKQAEDIMSARAELNTKMGGAPIEKTIEAGDAVTQGVKMKAEAASAAVDEAYTGVGKAGLLPEGQKGMVTHMQRIAKVNDFDQSLTETAKAMGKLREMSSFIEATGNRLPPTTLKKMEFYRRKLNRGIDAAENAVDKRQMITLKQEYDKYMKRALDRGLMTGDQEALTNLRAASDLHADYMKTFTQQDIAKKGGGRFKDDAGAMIQRMVEYDPNPEEVVNFLFGSSRLGYKKGAAKTVEKLGSILGKESDEFGTLRQAAFLRLTDPGKSEVFSGARFKTALTEALDKNKSMMDALFTPEEQAQMVRFADAVVKAQPDPKQYGNVSRSGHKMAEYVGDSFEKLMLAFGFSQGGPIGAVAAKGALESGKSLGKFRQSLAASDAINQAKPLKAFYGVEAGPVIGLEVAND